MFDLDQAASSVEFDPSVRAREENPWHGESEEASFDRRKIPPFLRPLFRKMPTIETAYWIIFFVISLSCTLIILRFVSSYTKEAEKFQETLSLAKRYDLMYEEAGSANASGSSKAILEKKSSGD